MADEVIENRSPSDLRTVISVDAMGGDRGAQAVVGGMVLSAEINPEIRFIVHGDSSELEQLIAKRDILSGRCEVRHAERAIAMDEKPSHAMRHGKDSSMWGAIDSVRDGEATVAVSCGNTGALMAISMVRLRRAPGINRPAIAILWPSDNPQNYNVMLDVGADIKADASDLLKFALMGASYARNGFGVAIPRVGLLNLGTEEHKGRAELKEAHEMIAAIAEKNDIIFVGFVEGGDIPSDRVDVIVTDGFTGNVALKTAEGTAKSIARELRGAFKRTLMSRIGALFAYSSMQQLREKIDPRRANGGVFLGLNGTVIKSHGGADATGVSAAIKLAFTLAQLGFADKIAARVASAVPDDDDTTNADRSENGE